MCRLSILGEIVKFLGLSMDSPLAATTDRLLCAYVLTEEKYVLFEQAISAYQPLAEKESDRTL